MISVDEAKRLAENNRESFEDASARLEAKVFGAALEGNNETSFVCNSVYRDHLIKQIRAAGFTVPDPALPDFFVVRW